MLNAAAIGSVNEKYSNNVGDGSTELKAMMPNRIQLKREEFLLLCERYEPLRKLIIPIRYFYHNDLNLNDAI